MRIQKAFVVLTIAGVCLLGCSQEGDKGKTETAASQTTSAATPESSPKNMPDPKEQPGREKLLELSVEAGILRAWHAEGSIMYLDVTNNFMNQSVAEKSTLAKEAWNYHCINANTADVVVIIRDYKSNNEVGRYEPASGLTMNSKTF